MNTVYEILAVIAKAIYSFNILYRMVQNKGNLYKWCCNCWSLKYYGNRRCKLAKCRVFLHKQDLFPFPSLTIPSLFISPLMHTFPLFLYFQPFPNHFCYPSIDVHTHHKFRATQKYYYELMSKSDVIMFFFIYWYFCRFIPKL